MNTYPKRAKGLIKQGRAERVSENVIRLVGSSDPPFTEDNMNNLYNTDNNNNINTFNSETDGAASQEYTPFTVIDRETGEVIEENVSAGSEAVETGVSILHANEPRSVAVGETPYPSHAESSRKAKILFFNAREWSISKDCPKTNAYRSFISDPFGNFTEIYTVGAWNWEWSQIETKDMTLEKNTDYEFVFWLNGGENDQNDEICRLEIMFDDDYENRYTYNLNRSYIRYVRHYKGWYLYSIPFNTGDACYTKLRFIAHRAFATLMHADNAESYSGLPEDLPLEGVPQRHNIVFDEGFPKTSPWSYMVFPDLSKNKERDKGKENTSFNFNFDSLDNVKSLNGLDIDIESIMDDLRDRLEDELCSDDFVDELIDEIDVDQIKKQIIQQIKDSLKI